jgi:hypothetical protein
VARVNTNIALVTLFSLAVFAGQAILSAEPPIVEGPNTVVAQKKKGGRDPDEIEGSLKALDLTTGTLTLSPGFGKKTGPDATYNLRGKELPVHLFSKYLELHQTHKLEELEAGDWVRVKLFGDDVIAVRVVAPTLFATVSEVNTSKQTVLLRLKRNGEKTLPLAANARLLINGQPAKLADFTPGLPVSMILDLKQTTILSLHDGKSLNKLLKLIR